MEKVKNESLRLILSRTNWKGTMAMTHLTIQIPKCKLLDWFNWLFTETRKKESLPNRLSLEDLDIKRYFLFYLVMIINFLSKLYAQCRAWIHDTEIKRRHILYQLSQPGIPQNHIFKLSQKSVDESIISVDLIKYDKNGICKLFVLWSLNVCWARRCA